MSTPPEQTGVVIRSREVWDKLCKVEDTLNDVAHQVKTTVKDHGRQLDDLSQRVRVLEEMRWRAAGAGAALGTAASIAIQLLTR
ncbi:hypothetical protein ACQEV4_42790 [Streptomyces shenzhenensis]|uniref:hypothetical protein n=1 Tax=Streptomyces shenzhenensis TaxID=943815 RepID=UPI003D8FCB43